MAKKTIPMPPKWMLKEPNPGLETRRFHNIDIDVWNGEVSLDSIQGWLGNPRTELHAEQFRSTYGREPSNDEMYQIVLNDDDSKEGLKIRDLAGSIYKNGVRVPIVLSHEGKLLDGNRRYYACMFLSSEGAPKQERKRFMQIPAIVLPKGTTSEIEDAIITEFNFASDFRAEWPYYVKAMRVFSDFAENGTDKDELEVKYGLPWRILRTWTQAAELCEKFLLYHQHSYLSKQFAYRHFIMFDEMMRRYKNRFEEANFRDAIFDILLADYPDNHRFRASADVIRLPEIKDNAEAWDALISRKGPEALKDAIRVLEVSAFDSNPDPNPRLKRVINGLEKLVAAGSLTGADSDLLEEFHRQTELVPGAPSDPVSQVNKMIEWLDSMTALEIAELKSETLQNLRLALERVLAMADSVADLKPRKHTRG